MTEGLIKIHLSHKEPNKELLWLRPRLDREGYDLLYFGAKGWTPLIDCSCCHDFKQHPIQHCEHSDKINKEVLVEIPDKIIEESNKHQCACP